MSKVRDEDFYTIGDAVYVKAELRRTRDYKDNWNWDKNWESVQRQTPRTAFYVGWTYKFNGNVRYGGPEDQSTFKPVSKIKAARVRYLPNGKEYCVRFEDIMPLHEAIVENLR